MEIRGYPFIALIKTWLLMALFTCKISLAMDETTTCPVSLMPLNSDSGIYMLQLHWWTKTRKMQNQVKRPRKTYLGRNKHYHHNCTSLEVNSCLVVWENARRLINQYSTSLNLLFSSEVSQSLKTPLFFTFEVVSEILFCFVLTTESLMPMRTGRWWRVKQLLSVLGT